MRCQALFELFVLPLPFSPCYQVVTRSDLVMIVSYPSGERITHHNDGTRICTMADGSWLVESPNAPTVERKDGRVRVIPAYNVALDWQADTGLVSAALPGGRNVVATCNAAVMIPTGGAETLEAAIKVLPMARKAAEADRAEAVARMTAEREVSGNEQLGGTESYQAQIHHGTGHVVSKRRNCQTVSIWVSCLS